MQQDPQKKFIYQEKREMTTYKQSLEATYKPIKDKFEKPEGLNKGYLKMFEEEIRSSQEGSSMSPSTRRRHQTSIDDLQNLSFSTLQESPKTGKHSPFTRKSQFFNNPRHSQQTFTLVAKRAVAVNVPQKAFTPKAVTSHISSTQDGQLSSKRHPILIGEEDLSTKPTFTSELLSPKTIGNNSVHPKNELFGQGTQSPLISPKSNSRIRSFLPPSASGSNRTQLKSSGSFRRNNKPTIPLTSQSSKQLEIISSIPQSPVRESQNKRQKGTKNNTFHQKSQNTIDLSNPSSRQQSREGNRRPFTSQSMKFLRGQLISPITRDVLGIQSQVMNQNNEILKTDETLSHQSIINFDTLKNASSLQKLENEEAKDKVNGIMLDCAKLYKGCDKFERKLTKAQKSHYTKMGKILKEAKRKQPKFELWKKDKQFLRKKQEVQNEISKLKEEQKFKQFNIADHINQTLKEEEEAKQAALKTEQEELVMESKTSADRDLILTEARPFKNIKIRTANDRKEFQQKQIDKERSIQRMVTQLSQNTPNKEHIKQYFEIQNKQSLTDDEIREVQMKNITEHSKDLLHALSNVQDPTFDASKIGSLNNLDCDNSKPKKKNKIRIKKQKSGKMINKSADGTKSQQKFWTKKDEVILKDQRNFTHSNNFLTNTSNNGSPNHTREASSASIGVKFVPPVVKSLNDLGGAGIEKTKSSRLNTSRGSHSPGDKDQEMQNLDYGKKMNPLHKLMSKKTFNLFKKFNVERFGSAYSDYSEDNSIDLSLQAKYESKLKGYVDPKLKNKIQTKSLLKKKKVEENPVRDLQDKLISLALKKKSVMSGPTRNSILRIPLIQKN